jgi:hypothetical protein
MGVCRSFSWLLCGNLIHAFMPLPVYGGRLVLYSSTLNETRLDSVDKYRTSTTRIASGLLKWWLKPSSATASARHSLCLKIQLSKTPSVELSSSEDSDSDSDSDRHSSTKSSTDNDDPNHEPHRSGRVKRPTRDAASQASQDRAAALAKAAKGKGRGEFL